jgi:HK97 family phage portal protein
LKGGGENVKLNFLKRMFTPSEEQRSAEIGLNDRRLLEMLGLDVAPGEVNVRGRNALKVETVYACVKILSESVSKLPLKIFQEDDTGIQKATRHSMKSLLKLRPNPLMSASDFWKCIEAQRSFGNAYAYIEMEPRSGNIVGLWPIDKDKVTIWIDDVGLLRGVPGFVEGGTRLWYEVDVGGGIKRKLKAHEMLHFKGSVTLDGIAGINPIDYLRSTIENAAAASKFVNNFYKQGLQVKGIVQYVGNLDEDAKRVFREKFESMSSGLKNSHRIALMPVGYQFTPMSLSMADAQFLENTELTIRQIATAFGIKMHQLNDLTRATFGNVEQMQLQFYTDTLHPILTGYEQELTWKLFTGLELSAGYYAKFNVDSILRGDLKTRYDAYRIGIQGGFLKPNEARAKEDMPPEDGGDRLYANGNFIPLILAGTQYAKKGGENSNGTGKGKKDPGDGDEGS